MKRKPPVKSLRLPIIAIDGPAGAGKTTTAREVARRLGFLHLDTGAMYRAIALHVLRTNTALQDAEAIGHLAETVDVALRHDQERQRIFLNAEDVTELVRTPEVTHAVTPVCEVPRVRARMVELQRLLGARGGVVAEGRDIGTVVFPQAELKIFLVADLQERARRRLREIEAAGLPANLPSVIHDIEERDCRDQQRSNSPLKQAPDAIRLDTTKLSFQQQVEAILDYFLDKCGSITISSAC